MITINRSDPVVYLVDDEFAIRDSLTLLLESSGQTVKSFDSAQAFLDDYKPEQAGCLILDVRMPLMSGFELQEKLAEKNITLPIIFISGNAQIPDSAKAFRAGAVDFLEKPFDYKILLQRIQEAINKDAEERAEASEKRRLQSRLDQLTCREKEVLSLIVSSHSSKEAGKILNISNRTIEVHRANIMEKMQVQNFSELMIVAMKCGIIAISG
ncbi:Response regulator protein TmoT [Candidatus Methylobacter favarea]|uniref:Response regulator protein TmoT n=1 Tax=Candidatus Methylobacter favarea TaxID=2707345 RepID=A0A8S0Y6Y5_9GAMM|nr:response regulator [Candidatus Methylobacter favarea]CAA9892469.1 Response regulator protein TmoT [Candidatus Methylobacter favarea]